MTEAVSKDPDGLRPFQRKTHDRAWASLYPNQGLGRFLVADEVGLGKTRVAAGIIRTLQHKTSTARKGTVVAYFAPNAELARQNLRVLRLGQAARDFPSRLTL